MLHACVEEHTPMVHTAQDPFFTTIPMSRVRTTWQHHQHNQHNQHIMVSWRCVRANESRIILHGRRRHGRLLGASEPTTTPQRTAEAVHAKIPLWGWPCERECDSPMALLVRPISLSSTCQLEIHGRLPTSTCLIRQVFAASCIE